MVRFDDGHVRKSESMTPIRAYVRARDSVRTVRILGWIVAGAIALGAVVALTELLAFVLFAGLLVLAAILHQPRRGLFLLSVLVPLSSSTLMPHELLGVTGMNPLNLTLLATLAGLVVMSLFPGSRRPLPLKELPLPLPLLVLMVLPMAFAAAHGSFSVGLIPEVLRLTGESSISGTVGYYRDLLVLPLLHVFFGLLLGLAVRVDGPGPATRAYLYGPLAGVSVLAVVYVFNAFMALGSLQAMADPGARPTLAAAAGMHPNEISLMFNSGLAWALFTARKASPRAGAALWAVAALMGGASVLTFSRGGFLGMLVVLIAFMLEMRRFMWIVVAAGLLAVGTFFLPDAVLDRITTGLARGDIEAVSAGRATMIWPFLLPVVADHWLLGGGMESILWSPPELNGTLFVTQPHNAYLALALDYGLVGGVMILSFHVWRWLDLRRLAHRIEGGALSGADAQWAQFVRGTSVMVPVLMVQAVTDNRLTPTPSQTLMWLAFGVAFGLRARSFDQVDAASVIATQVTGA